MECINAGCKGELKYNAPPEELRAYLGERIEGIFLTCTECRDEFYLSRMGEPELNKT
jgi:hypothetical protein